MGRLKRRTQQCRKLAKERELQTAKNNDDTYSNDNLGSDDGVSIDDEVGWTDEDEAEQLFLVLTKNMKALKHSKRPLVNVGNSRTTKYRKKIQAIENQKKNGQTLYQLLNNKNNTGGGSSGNNFDGGSSGDGSGGFFGGGSSGGSSGGGSSSGSGGGSKSDNANKTIKNALINRIENKLKLESEYLTLEYKLQLIAVQHYL